MTLDLWREMDRGASLAVASRHVDGGGVSDWAFHRRLLSRGAQLLGLILLPSVVGRVSDPMSGYFMVRRTAIGGRTMNPVGYKILVEVLGRGTIETIREVGYVFRERIEGESKVTGTLYVDYLRHLVRLRMTTLPLERFMRFALVGLSGVVVDMGLLYLLSDPRMLGAGIGYGKAVAAEVAVVNNFLWNDAWTFRRPGSESPGPRPKSPSFPQVQRRLCRRHRAQHPLADATAQAPWDECVPRQRGGHRRRDPVELRPQRNGILACIWRQPGGHG